MTRSSTSERVASVVLVCCALLMTGLVARRELGWGNDPTPPEATPYPIDDWDQIQSGGRVLTGASGTITLVEFSDFECPYCGRFHRTLDTVMGEYPTQLRVVYRHFPLVRLHVNARNAAVASECAAEQERFSDYHDALFADQANITRSPWTEIANRLGLDTTRFHSCLVQGRAESRLAEDSTLVSKFNLEGTPTVIVNGWVLPGTPNGQELRRLIDRELAKLP